MRASHAYSIIRALHKVGLVMVRGIVVRPVPQSNYTTSIYEQKPAKVCLVYPGHTEMDRERN